MSQKSITSFFSNKASSSSTSPFNQLKQTQSKPSKSPEVDVLKDKPPTKNSRAKSEKQTSRQPEKSQKRPKRDEVESAAAEVKKVRIAEDEDADNSSPPSSPIKSGKRRRVQIIESDESGSDVENTVTAPPPKTASPTTPSPGSSSIPKRKTAKLSKEFRSKLKNRVQTPHVSKMNAQVTEETSPTSDDMDTSPPCTAVPKPSPISSKLSNFSYKKRSTKVEATTPTISSKVEDGDSKETKRNNSELSVNLKEKMSPKSARKSPVKKEASPVKKEQKSPSPKVKATKSVKSPNLNPKGKEKASKGVSLVSANTTDGYNPGRTNYVPSQDAPWKAGQEVPYKALSDTLKVR